MKKVWILLYEEAVNKKDDEKIINALDDAIRIAKLEADDYVEGKWVGFVGRTDYKQFCEDAREAIIRNKDKHQMRVVEGKIADDAKMWWGYKFVKENEDVTKYLMAIAQ